MTLKIQGVLTISVIQTETHYLLRPLATYLSPDKKNAVLYGKDNEVKQIQLAGDSIKLTLDGSIQSKENFLIQFALQQKPVELHIDNENKITGFTYPALKP